MKTIHLILNSHIDPVWLWPVSAGVDAVLNTCRSACDIMEENPDLAFTCGEAWTYWQIERTAPELFERVKRLVERGQWHLIGGWWIQPDCNLPTTAGLAMQIELGREYFQKTFGRFPDTAFNIDSFGHSAHLPRLMNAAGQRHYIMMRPQEHEMKLPGRVFRWRTPGSDAEVTTFRIAGAYSEFGRLRLEHFTRALDELPEGVDDTMCFIGVGDHGGGPTRRAIAWCREQTEAIEGALLVFSTPERFFAAIAKVADRLPVYEGELQHHAIGCYSVVREIKTNLHRAEHLLDRVESIRDELGEHQRAELRAAWRDTCFNQFHDILAGSSIASACTAASDQLGSAIHFADDLLTTQLRRRRGAIGSAPQQRLILWNPNQHRFAGHVQYDCWSEGRDFAPGKWRLLDDAGLVVPHQRVQSEAAVPHWLMSGLLFHAELAAGETRTLRLEPCESAVAKPELPAEPELDLRLDLIPDASDTWSHGVDRYAAAPIASGCFSPPRVVDRGPLMFSWIRDGSVGQSRVREERRVYAGRPGIELLLDIDWCERHALLKLTVPLAAPVKRYKAGVCGGTLERAADGRELPLQDHCHLELADGTSLGIVCPEVYAADVSKSAIRLTLLRSPVFAHHDPQKLSEFARPDFTDRGHHRFRFRFQKNTPPADLAEMALNDHRPPRLMEMTEGMPR